MPSSKLDGLLPLIVNAGDAGVTRGKIKKKFGQSQARAAEWNDKLVALIRDGEIWGPLKFGSSELYFASGRGPSVETASKAIAALVSKSGVKLLSKAGLEKAVIGKNARFFAHGIEYAVKSRAIVELSCGNSKYYLHRDAAANHFRFEVTAPVPSHTLPEPRPVEPAPSAAGLTLESMLPTYRRLKAEQGGFSAVKIFDLMHALNGSKDDLHRLLIDETKAGRVTIHPTTSVELPKEVVDAAIRLPGFPEPFVTVVVKSEP
jgi:hypothetical protein